MHIRKVEDLWSQEKIHFKFDPILRHVQGAILEEIMFRSIKKYLDRPGHVLLPDGMISPDDIASSKEDCLLRANLLLEYWHGSKTLPCVEKYIVSITSSVIPEYVNHVSYPAHLL